MVAEHRKLKYDEIPTASIDISPGNVRKTDVQEGLDELARSIDEIGLQQPIVVYRAGERHKLIIGQRRFLACRDKLRWDKIPALISPAMNEAEAVRISFIENIQRLELDYRDKMQAATELLRKLKSVGKVAQALGTSQQTVRNYLGYEGVPEQLKKMVDERKISATTAISIARNIPDAEKAVEIAKKVKEMPTSEKRRNLIEVARENPTKTMSEISNLASKRKFRKITLNLTSRVAEALELACRDYKGEPEEIAGYALEQWLNKMGFLK